MSMDPIVFKYRDLFDVDSAPWGSAMHFGLQMESVAWREIIEQLCERLQPLAAKAKSQGLDFRILAVKQKFGTLRIAYRNGTDEIDAEIERAKDEALHISVDESMSLRRTLLKKDFPIFSQPNSMVLWGDPRPASSTSLPSDRNWSVEP